MGGVWERQIGRARLILHALMKTHGKSLNNESLHTIFIEAEAIAKSISDSQNLLTMKLKVIMPPAGTFSAARKTCRKETWFNCKLPLKGTTGQWGIIVIFRNKQEVAPSVLLRVSSSTDKPRTCTTNY